MIFLALWAVVLALLACWSAFVWAANALLTALLSHAGQMGAGDWQLPASLAAWLPGAVADWLAGSLENLAPQLQSLLGWVPALAGGVTLLGWVLWALGTGLLLVLGALSHVGLAAWQRTRRAQTVPLVSA